MKKYKSRPSEVLGASLPFHGVWPIMTMTIHINEARVSSIGVRIHAKRPTLPIFAVGGGVQVSKRGGGAAELSGGWRV